MYSSVQLLPHKTQSMERRHPWIFSGALKEMPKSIEDGEVVTVLDSRKNEIARGHFQHGSIAVRILTFSNEAIDQEFFNKRISNAVELRKKLHLFREDNSICRIIHGEGDELPGLVIDYYGGVAVIQCHSLGMYLQIELIKNALVHAIGADLKAVYNKSKETLPGRIPVEDGYVYGTCDTPHIALENGVKYQLDWITGQKTGFFIDQRENRALLAKYSAGAKILNTFCYSGGFSLAALKNGAKEVHSLDSSKKAIELTDANVELNGFSNHQSIVADAMNFIRETGEEYDIIILDPPAFAKHRDKRHQAVQGYKRLNAMAIQHIRPGGLLMTYSCSQVVDKQLFNNTIIAAAIESGRTVKILEQLHQPADHPINAFHPEGEYLKGLLLQII
ncbi:class I SAM-dependent rRNA methyltransferase [Fluviicola sp.]|uniref:class I SAM-dependent rRNA methyltransferase n=1 Tax=Fluviicola sp. TaxID=1917219 RepID=UPI0031D62352